MAESSNTRSLLNNLTGFKPWELLFTAKEPLSHVLLIPCECGARMSPSLMRTVGRLPCRHPGEVRSPCQKQAAIASFVARTPKVLALGASGWPSR